MSHLVSGGAARDIASYIERVFAISDFGKELGAVIHEWKPQRSCATPLLGRQPSSASVARSAYSLPLSSAARMNTSSSICSVSFPVNVFCWLGW
jgi:hypothetical protein